MCEGLLGWVGGAVVGVLWVGVGCEGAVVGGVCRWVGSRVGWRVWRGV